MSLILIFENGIYVLQKLVGILDQWTNDMKDINQEALVWCGRL